MNGIVIYQSKYGATAQYAQWISVALKLPVFEAGEIDDGQLNQYDFIILGSSVYVGKLLIKKWLKDNLKILWNKKIFLFAVCGTPLDKTDELDSYISASVPAEARNKLDVYFLPGRMKFRELSLWDRFVVKAGSMLAKTKETKTRMLTDYDQVNKDNTLELLHAVEKFKLKKQEWEML